MTRATTPSGIRYSDYITSDKWRDRKNAYLAISPRCERCESTMRLHVHHGTYENLGNEKDQDLFTLCILCHDDIHTFHNRQKTKRKCFTLLQVTKKFLGLEFGEPATFERVKKVRRKQKVVTDQEPCKSCGSKLQWKSKKLTPKRKRKTHFCKYLFCKSCRSLYMVEKYRKKPGEACSCEESEPHEPTKEFVKNTEPLKSYLKSV